MCEHLAYATDPRWLAKVQTRARRIIIRLAASWPYLKSFQNVSQAILSLPVAAVGGG